jgi:dihydroorotate dehydrogenase electron transfer subunit
MRTITRVVEEAGGMKTLQFIDSNCSQADPGQYIMVWIPGLEEIPMSLSGIGEEGVSSITVRPIGEATEALCSLTKGDKIGVRGPYGYGYKLKGEKPLIIAGGTGAASLVPLTLKLENLGVNPTFILGARDSSQLLFRERLEKIVGERLLIATDDGSAGFKGYASNYAEEVMDNIQADMVYTCGPELMMSLVFKATEERNLPLQASLERYIKCAVGLCGACAIGPYRVCKDGPVFDTEMLRKVSDEFGKSRMEPSGKVVGVSH